MLKKVKDKLVSKKQAQEDVEVSESPDPTEEQSAQTASELSIAERDEEGRDLRGSRAARLDAIKSEVDNALAHFENTSDGHDEESARVTVSGIRERLDAVRALVDDAINADEE